MTEDRGIYDGKYYVTRKGMRDTPKWPGKLEYGETDPKEDHDRVGKKGYRGLQRKEKLIGP